ncbi:MAG: UDP-glucose-hexose-1-phosphateuridylyltransfera se [Parcubacteria group bacterium GW2011_GWE2_38_18]|nr:MAG: UDP-glucose-hexose-1-phosphateuridylyltransfera se [Parcubacteria group bacterium GW2011_GWE2_38_18]
MFLRPQSEFRKHYFLNKYVIITPGRAKRPRDVQEQSVIHNNSSCVLCPEKIEKNLILDYIGGKINWEVMVLKNKYPAVTLNNPKAFGQQEVIIETPEHGVEMAEFSVKKIEQVLHTYIKRTKEISENKKIDYILIFKNSGSKAGASLHHSHSQVFATKILPPEVSDELTQAQYYKAANDVCPYCNIIKKEMRSKRKIFENSEIAVLAPYASEYHYEAWIFTKRHLDNITKLNAKEIKSVAQALKNILGKLHRIGLSYNFSVYQVISNTDQHFYFKIQPRDSIWAGVEMNTGIIVNSVSPEEAAKFYKK